MWAVLHILYWTLLLSLEFTNKLWENKKKKEMETLMMMTMLYPITIWITCALLLLLYFLLAHLLKLPCLCFIPYAEAFVADSVPAKVFAFVSRCALGRMCMCFCVVIERTRRTTA